MSNHYTEACFLIPCTEAIGLDALRVFEAIRAEDGETLSKISKEHGFAPALLHHCLKRDGDAGPDSKTILNPASLDAGDLDVLLDHYQFAVSMEEDALRIYSDPDFNIDGAVQFTQGVLATGGIDATVPIEMAHVCDKSRPGNFGGGVAIVGKDFVRHWSTGEVAQMERNAHSNGQHYSLCKVRMSHGDLETDSAFILKHRREADQHEDMRVAVSRFRGDAVSTNKNRVEFVCGTAVEPLSQTPITPGEYSVMKTHLSVLEGQSLWDTTNRVDEDTPLLK